MDGPCGRCEISQKDKYDLTYVWNLKNKALSSYIKTDWWLPEARGEVLVKCVKGASKGTNFQL